MSELDRYDYDLPKHLIAQSPAVCRTDARLLVVDRQHKSLEHKHIRDLPEILRRNDCLVINDTRVVPARLVGRRLGTGGHWEGLFLEASPDGLWRVLCKTRGRLKPGDTVTLIDATGQEDVRLQLGVKQADGTWVARPLADGCSLGAVGAGGPRALAALHPQGRNDRKRSGTLPDGLTPGRRERWRRPRPGCTSPRRCWPGWRKRALSFVP